MTQIISRRYSVASMLVLTQIWFEDHGSAHVRPVAHARDCPEQFLAQSLFVTFQVIRSSYTQLCTSRKED